MFVREVVMVKLPNFLYLLETLTGKNISRYINWYLVPQTNGTSNSMSKIETGLVSEIEPGQKPPAIPCH